MSISKKYLSLVREFDEWESPDREGPSTDTVQGAPEANQMMSSKEDPPKPTVDEPGSDSRDDSEELLGLGNGPTFRYFEYKSTGPENMDNAESSIGIDRSAPKGFDRFHREDRHASK